MPDKYHIHTVATPGKFRRVGKFGSVDWREDCSRCTNCVKPRCVYDVYKHETAQNRDPTSAIQTHYECKACLSCVQGCTKGILEIGVNPEYLDMGDAYWKPEIIATTWNQADTGRIPVSGAGYRGRFSGPGFDAIWTDMSEIVRPTRDGIHGREYISTMVDIGYKPMRLSFGADGRMMTPAAALIEIQMPALLDVPPWPMPGKTLAQARAAAARQLHTLAVISAGHLKHIPAENMGCVVPLVSEKTLEACRAYLPRVRMVELNDRGGGGGGDIQGNGIRHDTLKATASEALKTREATGSLPYGRGSEDHMQSPRGDIVKLARKVMEINPKVMVAVRMELTPEAGERISQMAQGNLKVFHLFANLHGCETLADGSSGRHIKDSLREIHNRLVKDGRRDEVTLIVGGGIALAEHMAKTIICGADLVAVNAPLLVALGCRVCRDAHANGACRPGTCPACLENLELTYAIQRMVNLMGAWHSQLIEVLGAMGIREIRRLRGEVGRAMFLEDLEKEAFGDLVRR